MRTRTLTTLTSLFVFAALPSCGGEPTDAATGTNALAGHWSQELEGGGHGMPLQFDGDSDRLMVHTAPREDGTHDHLHGTYEVQAGSAAVTVRCALLGDGNGDTWQGALSGEHLTLRSGGTELQFHRGEDPHGEHEHK